MIFGWDPYVPKRLAHIKVSNLILDAWKDGGTLWTGFEPGIRARPCTQQADTPRLARYTTKYLPTPSLMSSAVYA